MSARKLSLTLAVLGFICGCAKGDLKDARVRTQVSQIVTEISRPNPDIRDCIAQLQALILVDGGRFSSNQFSAIRRAKLDLDDAADRLRQWQSPLTKVSVHDGLWLTWQTSIDKARSELVLAAQTF